EPDRRLHDAWGSGGDGGSESRVRLLERRRADVAQRADGFRRRRAWVVDDQTVCHTRIDVTEIRVIENVVDLPAKLQRTSLAEFEILKEREIVVEDRRHAHRVAWHVADLPRRKRLRKTTDVESSRRAGCINAEVTLHRIASHERTRVDPAAGEVSDRRAGLCRRRRRSHTRTDGTLLSEG